MLCASLIGRMRTCFLVKQTITHARVINRLRFLHSTHSVQDSQLIKIGCTVTLVRCAATLSQPVIKRVNLEPNSDGRNTTYLASCNKIVIDFGMEMSTIHKSQDNTIPYDLPQWSMVIIRLVDCSRGAKLFTFVIA